MAVDRGEEDLVKDKIRGGDLVGGGDAVPVVIWVVELPKESCREVNERASQNE